MDDGVKLSDIFENEMLKVSVLSQVAFGYLDEQINVKKEVEKFNKRYRDNSFWVNTFNKFSDGIWGDDYANAKMELYESLADANLRSQMVVSDFKEAVDGLKDKFYGCDFSTLESMASSLNSTSGILNSTEFASAGYSVLDSINKSRENIADEINNLNKNIVIFDSEDKHLDSEEYLKSKIRDEHYYRFEPYRNSLEKCIEILEHNSASCDNCGALKKQLSDFSRKHHGGSFPKKLKRYCMRKLGFSLRIEKLAKVEIKLKKDFIVSSNMVNSYVDSAIKKLNELKGISSDVDVRKLEILAKKLVSAHNDGNHGDTKKFAILLKENLCEIKDILKQKEERSWMLAETSREILVPGLSLTSTYKILAGNEMASSGTKFSDAKIVEKLFSLGYKTDEISSTLDKFSPNFVNTSSKVLVSKISKVVDSSKKTFIKEAVQTSNRSEQKRESSFER